MGPRTRSPPAPIPAALPKSASRGEAAHRHADEWIVAITDITPLAREIHTLLTEGNATGARGLLPAERPYPAPDGLLAHLMSGE